MILCLLYSVTIHGQSDRKNYISKKDSILLINFWTDFKKAIELHDKKTLSDLFKFPFYCSPCMDYVESTDTIHASVLVTKKLFQDSVFRLFYDIPTKNNLTAKFWHKVFPFMISINDNKQKDGFVFSYARIPPSKTWEGSQVFVYLKKVKGKIIIEGLDTIP
jgi:hypothetical protein